MPRALLCWEYGAGLGHLSALTLIAKRLKSLGWETILIHPSDIDISVDQNFDCVDTLPHHAQLNSRRPVKREGASHNNLLYAMGLGDPKFVFLRMKLWQSAFAKHKPDVLIADFAPLALRAADQSLPSLAVGNGYTLPPVGIDEYPLYGDLKSSINSNALLMAINRGVELAQGHAIPNLPEIFRANVQCCTTFDFLDPFETVRQESVINPVFKDADRNKKGAQGEELFCYLTNCSPRLVDLIVKSLIAAGLPSFAYILDAQPEHFLQAEGTNLHLSRTPFPMSEIISRTRLAMHTGGHGMATEMLTIGIPQLIIRKDMEKKLLAQSLEKKGVGNYIPVVKTLTTELIVQIICDTFDNQHLRAIALDVANAMPEDVYTSALDRIISDLEGLV